MKISLRVLTNSVFALLILLPNSLQAANHPTEILLWPNGVPGASGTSDEDKPAIYPYLPDDVKNTGAVIVIFPGGGFLTRATDHEGVLVAQWLKSRGIAAFIVRYRIRPIASMTESLQDSHRAVQVVRTHAARFHISPERIGVIGFSAGAELAAIVGLKPIDGKPAASDPVERASSRAHFMILAYGSPNPSALGTTDDAASPAPAPAFLFCTAEDTGHLTGMINLYARLRQSNVPVEAHFFVNGEHGVGLAQGDPVLGEWPDLMFNWIRAGGFLAEKTRVGLRGIARLDGEPLPRGAVVLTPLDSPEAPSVVGYVFNTGPTLGQFAVPQGQGPTPGRYRIEIRQYAVRWASSSRDPFFRSMTQKSRNGTLTEAERQEWMDFVRKRDLSPTIDDQRVFRRKHPKDGQDMTIEIQPDRENEIAVEVFSR